MNTRYTLNDINFVWDTRKAAANARKHKGISFELACEAFSILFFKLWMGASLMVSRERQLSV
jgi:uncharacterized DUF497 family protein